MIQLSKDFKTHNYTLQPHLYNTGLTDPIVESVL